MLYLNKICIGKDTAFETLIVDCGFLTRFANDIRYPHKYEANETDSNFSINIVEKVRKFMPIAELLAFISEDKINENE